MRLDCQIIPLSDDYLKDSMAVVIDVGLGAVEKGEAWRRASREVSASSLFWVRPRIARYVGWISAWSGAGVGLFCTMVRQGSRVQRSAFPVLDAQAGHALKLAHIVSHERERSR